MKHEIHPPKKFFSNQPKYEEKKNQQNLPQKIIFLKIFYFMYLYIFF